MIKIKTESTYNKLKDRNTLHVVDKETLESMLIIIKGRKCVMKYNRSARLKTFRIVLPTNSECVKSLEDFKAIINEVLVKENLKIQLIILISKDTQEDLVKYLYGIKDTHSWKGYKSRGGISLTIPAENFIDIKYINDGIKYERDKLNIRSLLKVKII